ncbi:helix-turn-helix domain-containing protein [Halorubrum salipaludis]|uniref:helix-turn-helix domain-containing protein n=1 Tax=Halorubrum salipaludis TaxID=2032630 RepID=UPI001181A3B5|nr:helix-turn-helix transcriptional regulator [Halorubrum salipaludis]
MGEISNWRSKRVLRKYHVEKGWSAEEIAEEAGVSPALITDYLNNRDLLNASSTSSTERKRGDQKKEEKQETHTCPECGDEFDSVDDWSDHHQSEHYSWDVHEMQQPE